MRLLLTLSLFVGLLAVSPARAADAPTDGAKLYPAMAKLKKPKSSKDSRAPMPYDEVHASLWLPDGVPVVRGLLFNPFHDKFPEQGHWRAASQYWGFGIVGANYFAVPSDEFKPTLSAMLKQLAADTDHPEIEHAPLCLVGMSAGAGMCVSFAEAMPERIIAAGLTCLEVGPRGKPSHDVPMLTVFGEKDGRQMIQLAEKLPVLRSEHAQWGTAVQWGRKHEFARAGNVLLPLFDAAIRQRYPKDADPRKGPVTLATIAEKDGWLGDPSGWGDGSATIAKFADFKGEVDKACWFPDAGTATVWQALTTKGPRLTIAEPAGLGDGKPFAALPADKPVDVTLKAKPDFPGTIELYDRDVKLGTFADDKTILRVERLTPGVHVLIAVAVDGEGRRFPSPPNAVVVAR